MISICRKAAAGQISKKRMQLMWNYDECCCGYSSLYRTVPCNEIWQELWEPVALDSCRMLAWLLRCCCCRTRPARWKGDGAVGFADGTASRIDRPLLPTTTTYRQPTAAAAAGGGNWVAGHCCPAAPPRWLATAPRTALADFKSRQKQKFHFQFDLIILNFKWKMETDYYQWKSTPLWVASLHFV